MNNDFLITVGVFGFAFTSGFINTWAYQLAPQFVDDTCLVPVGHHDDIMEDSHANDDNITAIKDAVLLQQTNLLNVCFSASVVFGESAISRLPGII